MKKLAVVLSGLLVALTAFASFAATNPFMDVPMNHWAYDAIGQLAAHGILSGYPDGTYKGKQPTTRYEMASALARALAVVDMTKASKQDVEMLKRLVVEFKDELEALGVRVDELDERVAVFENRLGGWHIQGSLVLDVTNRSAKNAARADGDGYIGFDNARIVFERTFGDDDQYHFYARLRNDGSDSDGRTDNDGNSAYFDRYFFDMPFFFDTKLRVGRFLYDVDTAYRPDVAATGSWLGDSVLTDVSNIGFALEKNFGLGSFLAYVSHWDRIHPNIHVDNPRSWEAFLMGSLQFTEQIGFDIGAQAMFGDNAEDSPAADNGSEAFNNLWTVFAGLRFNFNDNIALKGTFYHQKIDTKYTRNGVWEDYGYGINKGTAANPDYKDDANHWSVIIDVAQEALKYTSIWLEYGQYDAGFWTPQGWSTFMPSESDVLALYHTGNSVAMDMNYWRVVLGQQWNEKWATHLFYYGYKFDKAKGNDDGKPSEYGVGVQYRLNDATTMGLNYVHVDSDLDGNDNKDNVIRFRTSITF